MEQIKQAEQKQMKQPATFWSRLTGGSFNLGFFARTEDRLRDELNQINAELKLNRIGIEMKK